jgi:hypothetical protein
MLDNIINNLRLNRIYVVNRVHAIVALKAVSLVPRTASSPPHKPN